MLRQAVHGLELALQGGQLLAVALDRVGPDIDRVPGDVLLQPGLLRRHVLDVRGGGVDPGQDGGGHHLIGVLAEALDEAGTLLERVEQRQHGVDLDVVLGGFAEALDGLVHRFGDPVARAVGRVPNPEEEDEALHDGDQAQDDDQGEDDGVGLLERHRASVFLCGGMAD